MSDRRRRRSPTRWRWPSGTVRWPGSRRRWSPNARGSAFRVRACWSVLDGSVALEARGTTLDACHEKIARQVLRLWPALEEAAEWL